MVWYSLVRRSKGAEILADRPRKVQRASKAQHQLLFWQMFVQPAGDLSCDSARARAALIGSTAAVSATTSFAALRCIGDAVSTLFWLRFHQHVKVNCIVGISGRHLRAGCSPAFTTSSRLGPMRSVSSWYPETYAVYCKSPPILALAQRAIFLFPIEARRIVIPAGVESSLVWHWLSHTHALAVFHVPRSQAAVLELCSPLY